MSITHLSLVYVTSITHLSLVHATSIMHLSLVHATSIMHLPLVHATYMYINHAPVAGTCHVNNAPVAGTSSPRWYQWWANDRCKPFVSVRLATHAPSPGSKVKQQGQTTQVITNIHVLSASKYGPIEFKLHYTCRCRFLTWRSLAGFQSISKRTSRDAPIRFKPWPPALELSRNTTAKTNIHVH